MKKVYLALCLAIAWLPAITQSTVVSEQQTAMDNSIPVKTFVYAGVYGDSTVHIIWENYDQDNIKEIMVESSADGINYTIISKAIVSALTDIHSYNYPKWINYGNNILLSSEHGTLRYIYNDVIADKKFSDNPKSYRIKMITFSGTSYVTETIKFSGANGGKDNVVVKDPSPVIKTSQGNSSGNKGGDGGKPGCPSVGTPSSGFQISNPVQTQTLYGQCCSWVQTLYESTNMVGIVCGGTSYAWCCSSVPGGWDYPGVEDTCASGFASDPCCVHSCIQYTSCSCQPWECCASSLVNEWVVTSVSNGSPITITPAIVNETCAGMCNGSITITPSNGTAPYTYSWSNGDTNAVNMWLCPGNYSVTVTDKYNCQVTGSYNITTIQTVTAAANSNSPICAGSNLNLTSTPTGCTSCNYSWIGPGFTSTSQNPVITAATAAATGTYTVTVSDAASGCNATASVSVVVNPVPIVSITGANVKCFGGSDGEADLTVTGCTPNQYSWSNGAASEDLSGIAAGNYCVVVTCPGSCQANTCVTIGQPTQPLVLTMSHTNVNCFGAATGTASVAVTGGTVGTGYLYMWSNTATSSDIYNLGAGQYCVTVTDANGCTASNCVAITQPATPVTGYIVKKNVKCYGACTGEAIVIPSGGNPGTGGYTYLWTPTGTVNDTLDNICAGVYNVEITDGAGCTAATSTIITQPAPCPPIILKPVHILCYGDSTGEVDLTDPCIQPTNTYLWSNGATTQDLYQVPADWYSVTITDSVGCKRNAFTNVNQPVLPLSDSIIAKNVSCHNGSDGCIDLVPYGGTPPYTCIWSPVNDTVEDICNIFLGTDSIKYIVTITDANGCSITDSVTLKQPHAPLKATITGTNILCNGELTGAVNLTPSGGTPHTTGGYTYDWSNGAHTKDLVNIPAGDYCVTITDAKGCDTVYCITLTEPPPIVVELTPLNENCPNSCDGAILASVSGGVQFSNGDYTYLWNSSPPQNTKDATLLCQNIYILTVTDSVGCHVTNTATVSTNWSITANGMAEPVFGVYPLIVDFAFTGNGATSYEWNFQDGSTISTEQNPVHEFEQEGQYNVMLVAFSDSPYYCMDTFYIMINVKIPAGLEIPNVFTPNGDGMNDLFIVKGQAIETFNCAIYNRWGKKIYEWTNYLDGWDGKTDGGKDASDGVYYYILSATGEDKTEFNRNGTVTLIRGNQ